MQKLIRDLIEQITNLGGLVIYGLIAVVALILEKYALFLQLALSLIVIVLLGMLIKYLYFIERPKKQHYKNILEKIDASSFPSIHSARITSLAIILAVFFNEILFTLLAVIVALIVMYSRIYLQKHRFVDVVGGTILGTIIALLVVFV